MKKNYIVTLMLFCVFSTKLFGSGENINLALDATVTTSFVSSWETLSAVNDGVEPSNSSDNGNGAYGNWNGEGDYNTYNWVQYEWDNYCQIDSVLIYWWSDGGGISQPTDAYIEYWYQNSWVDAGKIGTILDTYNSLDVDLWTNKIRINMVSNTSTGILEWKVFGPEQEPCDPTVLSNKVVINDGAVQDMQYINVLAGDNVNCSIGDIEGGNTTWSGPANFSSSNTEITFDNISTEDAGIYSVLYVNECGAKSSTSFYITVRNSNDGDAYTWPEYSPAIAYDFRDEFPGLEMPTENLQDCDPELIAGTQSSGWWTFMWGHEAKSVVTEAAITPMLDRMNEDFAYFRDVMGWPPDKRVKDGFRSTIYLYGSGLCTDNEDSTALGGWQSSVNGYPMVLISYYPVYSFDPDCPYNDRESQMGAVVHEGIHSVLADLPGCKNAAWFHEGGNTWLQQEAESTRSGDYSSMGFLNGATFIAPFMPIECYSGWLQDGSFGGPSAEGVNEFDGDQQICTWRTYLGGTQYGNTFPAFLGQTLGNKSIPWIWRYCESRVLEGIADSLGGNQMRRLIMEYRAKQTLIDFGKWTGAIRDIVDDNFGISIGAEWEPYLIDVDPWKATPYAKTSNDGNGLLTPEARTTPGWSGANQIPLLVSGDTVAVDFIPIDENMSCQLCYRAEDGTTIYSEPVFSGTCNLRLDKKPANDIVFAVVCNTDYVYKGEETRTAHFDYQIQLVNGIEKAANIHQRWYAWDEEIENIETSSAAKPSLSKQLAVYPNPVKANGIVTIDFLGESDEEMQVEIFNQLGQLIYKEKCTDDLKFELKDRQKTGFLYVKVKGNDVNDIFKVLVK
ncbi:MAG: T9SS type A sorting domain-containing protein [Prolixibacteraceae bacterium]|nr:T9SS type A sorting domain-containing protein [Prolixibacteraceae bacterium]